MSADIYTRLLELLPDQPVLTGTVSALYAGGTALIVLPGGAQQRVRNPFGAIVGASVYMQDGAIIGDAPVLPYVLIEI